MKITKKASGKKSIKMSRKEWESIGSNAGWMKESQSKPSLREIFEFQNRMSVEDQAETRLDDFILKALRVGYDKESIVEGLRQFYSQHPSSGEGIFDRAVAKYKKVK